MGGRGAGREMRGSVSGLYNFYSLLWVCGRLPCGPMTYARHVNYAWWLVCRLHYLPGACPARHAPHGHFSF